MRRHHNRLSQVILLVIAAILLLGGVFFLFRTRQKNTPPNEAVTQQKSSSSQIDMSPATDEEKSDSEQRKDMQSSTPSDTTNPTSTTPKSTKQVSPVIVNATMAQSLQVRAYIPGIYEEGGTCTLEAVQGANKVSKQTSGFKDATTTTCTAFSVPRSEFPNSGEWKLTVTYESSTAYGVSQTVSTEIK